METTDLDREIADLAQRLRGADKGGRSGYPEELRAEVRRVAALADLPGAELSARLGIAQASLRAWCADGPPPPPAALTAAETALKAGLLEQPITTATKRAVVAAGADAHPLRVFQDRVGCKIANYYNWRSAVNRGELREVTYKQADIDRLKKLLRPECRRGRGFPDETAEAVAQYAHTWPGTARALAELLGISESALVRWKQLYPPEAKGPLPPNEKQRGYWEEKRRRAEPTLAEEIAARTRAPSSAPPPSSYEPETETGEVYEPEPEPARSESTALTVPKLAPEPGHVPAGRTVVARLPSGTVVEFDAELFPAVRKHL